MRTIRLCVLGIVFVGFVSILYIACSDSGSGGGDGNPPPQTSSEAELDQDTVDHTIELIDDALPFCSMNSSISSSLTTMMSAIELAQDYSDQFKLARAANKRVQPQAEGDDEIRLDGNCGGALIIGYTEDPDSGLVSGEIALDNLCLELAGDTESTQLNANGTLELSGSVQAIDAENDRTELNASTADGGITLSDGETDFSIVLDDAGLIVTERDDGLDMGFTLSQLVLQETSQGSTDTYTLQDVSMGLSTTDLGNDESRIELTIDSSTLEEDTQEGTRTYSLQDVDIVITDMATSSELTVSGTFIDSEEGSVTIATPTPIVVSDTGELTAGVVQIGGANGTSVLMEAVGNNSFDIQVDTDGDGDYDYEPGVMDCSELDTESLL